MLRARNESEPAGVSRAQKCWYRPAISLEESRRVKECQKVCHASEKGARKGKRARKTIVTQRRFVQPCLSEFDPRVKSRPRRFANWRLAMRMRDSAITKEKVKGRIASFVSKLRPQSAEASKTKNLSSCNWKGIKKFSYIGKVVFFRAEIKYLLRTCC